MLGFKEWTREEEKNASRLSLPGKNLQSVPLLEENALRVVDALQIVAAWEWKSFFSMEYPPEFPVVGTGFSLPQSDFTIN